MFISLFSQPHTVIDHSRLDMALGIQWHDAEQGTFTPAKSELCLAWWGGGSKGKFLWCIHPCLASYCIKVSECLPQKCQRTVDIMSVWNGFGNIRSPICGSQEHEFSLSKVGIYCVSRKLPVFMLSNKWNSGQPCSAKSGWLHFVSLHCGSESSLTNMSLSWSRCQDINHTLKHVEVRSASQ